MVANNIFIATGPSSNGFTTVWNNNNGNYPSAITQVNNVWYTPTANTLRFHTNVGGTDSFYSTLAAFQAATGFETGSVATNPLVAGAPATGNCASLTGPQPCPAGWTPGTGSPAIGTGLDLTMPPYSLTIGSQDYYGNSIPTPRWIGGVQ